MPQSFWLKALPFIGIGIVYIFGGNLDIMDIDASQYASIAKEMMETGEYLQVKHRHKDYLDKPPLLFWTVAICFQIFGVHNFVYRIPSILFSILGAYSVYRFTKLYYSERAAYLSSLIMLSSQAFFLMNHDVRTDGLLANCVIFAIWQLSAFNLEGKWHQWILGFVGIGLAMLAKGPIGAVTPVAAFTVDFILKRQWKSFFRWQWLAGLLVTALVLLPMSIGLYLQFDLHPEKSAYGIDSPSGLKFFYWTQSFGRITGESSWDNNVMITFQAENFIWSFLPWTFLFPPSLFIKFREVFRSNFKFNIQQEAITLGGFVLPFVAVSLSKYQLPHYSYVVFPLAAILTGIYVDKLLENAKTKIKSFQWSVGLQILTIAILWILLFVLSFWAFPLNMSKIWVGIIAFIFLGATTYFLFKAKNPFQKLILPSLITIIGVNFMLNTHTYPYLFQYQIGSVVAKYVRYETDIPVEKFLVYKTHFHSVDFYSEQIIKEIKTPEDIESLKEKEGETFWAYTNQEGIDNFEKAGLKTTKIKSYERYHISTLTPAFINPNTRKENINMVFLVKIEI